MPIRKSPESSIGFSGLILGKAKPGDMAELLL